MEIFVAVVIVFAVTVGLLQPFGGDDLAVGSDIYCITSEFNQNIQFFRAYRGKAEDRIQIQSSGVTLYRENIAVLSNVELDLYRYSDGQGYFQFTDFGREILARVTREHKGEFLALYSGDELISVWPVEKELQLNEEEGFPVPVKDGKRFGSDLCPSQISR